MSTLQLHIIGHNDVSKRQLQHFRRKEPSRTRMPPMSKRNRVSMSSNHIKLPEPFIFFIRFIRKTEWIKDGGVRIMGIVEVSGMASNIEVCSLRYVGTIGESERLTRYPAHHYCGSSQCVSVSSEINDGRLTASKGIKSLRLFDETIDLGHSLNRSMSPTNFVNGFLNLVSHGLGVFWISSQVVQSMQ
jgi:hypothetical protein